MKLKPHNKSILNQYDDGVGDTAILRGKYNSILACRPINCLISVLRHHIDRNYPTNSEAEQLFNILESNKIPLPAGSRESFNDGSIRFARFAFGWAAEPTYCCTGGGHKPDQIQPCIQTFIHNGVDDLVDLINSCAHIWRILNIDRQRWRGRKRWSYSRAVRPTRCSCDDCSRREGSEQGTGGLAGGFVHRRCVQVLREGLAGLVELAQGGRAGFPRRRALEADRLEQPTAREGPGGALDARGTAAVGDQRDPAEDEFALADALVTTPRQYQFGFRFRF